MTISSLGATAIYEAYNLKQSMQKAEPSVSDQETTSDIKTASPEIKKEVSEYTPNEYKTGEAAIASNPNVGQSERQDTPKSKDKKATDDKAESSDKKDSGEKKSADQLTDEERVVVDKLKARDAEVRTHEQAHISAGGAYVTGGVSYSTQTGPDGKDYAVGGEVSIDTSPVSDDPEATLRKAQVIQAAAMAPASPSGQDRAVAAAAAKMAANAMSEIMSKESGKTSGTDEKSKTDKTDATAKDKNKPNSNSLVAANSNSIKAYQYSNAYTDQSSARGQLADYVA